MKGQFQKLIRSRVVNGRRLTVRYLAELAGVGRSQLQQMLSGKRAGGESWPKVLRHLTLDEAAAIGREKEWHRVLKHVVAEAMEKPVESSTGNSVPPGTVAGERKPRLFYYEDAVDGWAPIPTELEKVIDTIIDVNSMQPGEVEEIAFKRWDMTDAEMDALPEV